MADKKPSRTIFQPKKLVATLIKKFQNCQPDLTIGDFVNSCIENCFCPYHAELRTETQRILQKMNLGEEITQEELQNSLANAVKSLRDYPIGSYETLDQILIHFTTGLGMELRYDYVTIVDDHQDEELKRLNEILNTLDDDFNPGKREFGERASDIFRHWDKLCSYPEIYSMLATIIRCENIYIPLDEFRVLDLIMRLDYEMVNNTVEKKKEPYPTDVTLKHKIIGLRYAINVYQCDSGYAALSNDFAFENMPDDFRNYENDWVKYGASSKPYSEETLQELIEFESRGKFLLKQIYRNNIKRK